jgi:hypothetical protein
MRTYPVKAIAPKSARPVIVSKDVRVTALELRLDVVEAKLGITAPTTPSKPAEK